VPAKPAAEPIAVHTATVDTATVERINFGRSRARTPFV
jgi:hypothetical protein